MAAMQAQSRNVPASKAMAAMSRREKIVREVQCPKPSWCRNWRTAWPNALALCVK